MPAKLTTDGLWDADELESDVYDVCIEVMTNAVIDKYKYLALYNKDVLIPDYMSTKILNSIGDVVELYNKCGSDSKCSIELFDNSIKEMIDKILKENLVK